MFGDDRVSLAPPFSIRIVAMTGKSGPVRPIFSQDGLFPGASAGGLIRVGGVQSENRSNFREPNRLFRRIHV